LVSASHRLRPRIGSLGRMTGTSTRGSSSRSFGDCALTAPLGLEPPFPCKAPGAVRSPPRRGLDIASVPAPPDRRRADRRGTRLRGDVDPLPPRGIKVVPVSLGAGAFRPHPHPGMATLARRPVSAGHWTGIFGLRHLVPLRRFLPSHPTVRSRPRDRFRSFPPPRSGRQVAVLRSGPGRSHDGNKNVRPPWSDPVSAGDVLGPQRPSPGYTMPPCGAPRCDLGRAGLLHNRHGEENIGSL